MAPRTGGEQARPDLIGEVAGMTGVKRSLVAYAWHVAPRIESTLYRLKIIPKRSGSERILHVPANALKAVQRGILRKVLAGAPMTDASHGFITGRSTTTNATPHVGKRMVIKLDLRDFFPTITAPRVFGLFRRMGFEPRLAHFLTRLTTFKGQLPQGAPTSPMLANLAARRLDARLAGLAAKIGADYTRYADDLTFSGDEEIRRYLPAIRAIVTEEGFFVNEEKVRILRRGRRQTVTGLTVNEKVSVPRHLRRRLRAALHRQANGGRLYWGGRRISAAALQGHVAYQQGIQG